MRPSESRASRALSIRLRQRVQEAGLPSYAPVASAVSVAMAASRGGAGADDAYEAGWTYLQIWARRWPAPMTAITPPGPSIRLASPVRTVTAAAS